MNSITKEHRQKWEHFVEYATSNGFIHYIGNLSFVNYKTGDILKLVGDGKVSFIKRNATEDAEFSLKEGE